MDICDLQRALGYEFDDQELLTEALTQSTWVEEARARYPNVVLRDQQRLEFLGDAYLGYLVGLEIFRRFPRAPEGELTDRRAALVKGDFIRALGERLGLIDLIRAGRGESARLQLNRNVLEDTVEAIIGAVLVDGGESAATELVWRLFLADGIDAFEGLERDPIRELNELWQQRFRCSPPKPAFYQMGPDDMTWYAEVQHPEGGVFLGNGRNQQEARRAACAQVVACWPEDA